MMRGEKGKKRGSSKEACVSANPASMTGRTQGKKVGNLEVTPLI